MRGVIMAGLKEHADSVGARTTFLGWDPAKKHEPDVDSDQLNYTRDGVAFQISTHDAAELQHEHVARSLKLCTQTLCATMDAMHVVAVRDIMVGVEYDVLHGTYNYNIKVSFGCRANANDGDSDRMTWNTAVAQSSDTTTT
jgi:hypothetical protein